MSKRRLAIGNTLHARLINTQGRRYSTSHCHGICHPSWLPLTSRSQYQNAVHSGLALQAAQQAATDGCGPGWPSAMPDGIRPCSSTLPPPSPATWGGSSCAWARLAISGSWLGCCKDEREANMRQGAACSGRGGTVAAGRGGGRMYHQQLDAGCPADDSGLKQ